MASQDNNNNTSVRFYDVYSTATASDYEEFLFILDDYGWRKLGSELGFTARELDRFEKKSNPSKEMIDTWMHQQQATLKKMHDALAKIDHFTARRQLDKAMKK